MAGPGPDSEHVPGTQPPRVCHGGVMPPHGFHRLIMTHAIHDITL